MFLGGFFGVTFGLFGSKFGLSLVNKLCFDVSPTRLHYQFEVEYLLGLPGLFLFPGLLFGSALLVFANVWMGLSVTHLCVSPDLLAAARRSLL